MPDHYPPKEKKSAHESNLSTFLWGDLSLSEKPSEIKPPLKKGKKNEKVY